MMGKTGQIELTKGKVALVDDQDYRRVSQLKWCAFKSLNTWYAIRKSSRAFGKRGTIYMHRFIMKPANDLQIDHINGNGLDCRRSNMRTCTRTQNAQNRCVNRNSKSGYKGVSWHKGYKKWWVKIYVKGKNIDLGLFDNLKEAAQAYNVAAYEYYGDFARPNIVTD